MDRAPGLERCPYDGTPVVADAYRGGFVLLSCECCNAAWELHNLMVLRVREPDWDSVDDARTARTPVVELPPT